MKMTDLQGAVPRSFDVVRDGEFHSLGMINHRHGDMLVYIESEDFLEQFFKNEQIRCVITLPSLAAHIPANYGLAISDTPKQTFYASHFHLSRTAFYGDRFSSAIGADSEIHPSAVISEHNVRIGKRCRIEPGVVIFAGAIIGDDVTLRAGAKIGAQGFEFKRFDGGIVDVPHTGGVKLAHRVEVQANACIDRGTFGGFTEVGDDTKLDNMVHIAHHAKIGRRCLIAAGAVISGNVVVGDDVWIGPNATISNLINIGNNAFVALGSTIIKDVPPSTRVLGRGLGVVSMKL